MKLFGTDGVRGVANAELTPETAYRLGRVLAWRLREVGQAGERVVFWLGKDPRLSSDLLEMSLAAGIMSSGGDVALAGIVPTPAVAHLVSAGGDLAGVAGAMVSASHNPVEDNGIKCFSGEGHKLPDELETEIEKMVAQLAGGRDHLPRPTGGEVGRSRRRDEEAREAYLRHLAVSVDGWLTPPGRRLKVVLDCAHGSACLVAPQLFARLGAEVAVIHGEPDGARINVSCGSTSLDDLQKAVLAERADVGLAFDGDADRCLAVDERGRAVDGDSLLAIFGRYFLERGMLAGRTVVATVMSNLGLKLHLDGLGIKLEATAVGDRHVLAALRAGGYNLGGEQSGHLIFGAYATTGDGVLTAIQLCRVLGETGASLGELAAGWERFPQILLNVAVRDRHAVKGNRRIEEAVQAVERELGEEGRVLLRPSGTEPLIRVMVEGREKETIHRLAAELAQAVAAELG